MSTDVELLALLGEIRDNQRLQLQLAREHAARAEEEARRAAENVARSIANQEQAIRTQQATARLYRRVVAVAGIVLVSVLVLLGFLSFG